MASAQPTLPNLLVIGASKCGSTSLHRYLALHPQIFMSKRKELAFFDTRLRWDRGIDWYKSNFDASFPVNGETSPEYTIYPHVPGVPERIKSILGTPKLIYILRDPVERMLAYHAQIVDLWPQSRPFDVAKMVEDRALYLHGSSYFFQLSQYLKVFPRESILVLVLERLGANSRDVMRQAFRFLGVDETFWSPAFDRRLHTEEEKRFIAPWFDRWAPRCVKRELQYPKWMPWKMNRAVHGLARRGGRPITVPAITRDEDFKLQDLLKTDVTALRNLLGDPLPEWRAYA